MILFWLSCTCEREFSPPESASRRPRRVSTGSTGTTCILESLDCGARNCSGYWIWLLLLLFCWLWLCSGMVLLCHEWLDPDRLSVDELPMAASDDDDAERRSDDTSSFTSKANAGWNCGSSAFTAPRPRMLPPLSERCCPKGVRLLLLLWKDAFRSTFGLVMRCLDDMDVDVDGPHVDANDGWLDDDALEPVGDTTGIS